MSNQLTAAAVLAVALCTAGVPAAAQSSDVPSETVPYRDLDLSTQAGAHTMALRIEKAVDRVCREVGGGPMDQYLAHKACRKDTIARALAKLNSPVVTAQFGAGDRRALALAGAR
jgi:UrcA family protein